MSETETNSIKQQPDSPPSASLSDTIAQLISNLKEDKKKIDYIQPEILPDIDLYMDQVTTFMDTHLVSSKRYDDDKILTKTMINNYAKNNLLPPPEKKKYSKDHLFLLTFIYYFKNMLSMSDIQCLLEPVKDHFFQNSVNGVNLEDIYREVFSAEEGIREDIIDDIMEKYAVSRQSFGGVDVPEHPADKSASVKSSKTVSQKPMLQDFAFVCMLCYDIFLKKQVVEKIIDEIAKDKILTEKKKRK